MSDQPNAAGHTFDFEFTELAEARNYRAALMRDFAPYLRGNVLEVGCGIGQFSSELLKTPEIHRLLSVEPDAAFCAQLRARLPNLELLHGTVADLDPETLWDAILSINVLEHIDNDVQELSTYYRLLQSSKGALCLFVPARPELHAPIDKDFGHFRRYTRSELQRKLKSAGFRLQYFRYFNFIGYFLWWVSFCLLKRRRFDVTAVRLFDLVAFPLIHGFESHICSPPIGQSLIAIAVAQ
jgi:SAM-dependent methyltransferase